MSSKEIYLKRLKTMQETAHKIKPTPKSVSRKISLPRNPLRIQRKKRLPVLTIIAGPIWSWKITIAKNFCRISELRLLTSDREFYAIWSEFNFDPYIEQGAFERAQKLCTERRAAALDKSKISHLKLIFTRKMCSPLWICFDPNVIISNLFSFALKVQSIAIERVKDRVAKEDTPWTRRPFGKDLGPA